MNTLNDKLRRFEAAILKTAEQKRDQIVKETNELKQNELNSTEDTALTTAYEMIQGEVSEISAEQAREISKIRFDQKRRYLVRRGELEAELFAAVKKRLCDYAETEGYKEDIKASAAKLANEFEGGITFKIAKRNAAIADFIKQSFGKPCTVEVSDDVEIGGFIAEDTERGYICDLSLDSILADQKSWFYQNCKL